MRRAPCFECGGPADFDHHVVPRSRGGRHTVPLCDRCHALAHDASLVALATAGRQRAKERGDYQGGRPPFGYRLSGGNLEAIEEEQRAIARMGELYLSGSSAYAICAALDREAFPSRGARWNVALVIKVLKRLGLWDRST